MYLPASAVESSRESESPRANYQIEDVDESCEARVVSSGPHHLPCISSHDVEGDADGDGVQLVLEASDWTVI